jgi:hypothetical protein
MNPRTSLLPIVAAALMLSCGESPERVADEVPDAPMPVCTLTIADSIGVELGDSSYVFGSIEGAGYTPDGNIAVLDRISADIRIFSPGGDHIQTIGGRGGGPGELRNPLGLFIFPDGRLGVMDPWRSGIHTYTSTGEYIGLDLQVTSQVHLGPLVVDDSSFIAHKLEVIAGNESAPELAFFIGLFPMTVEPEITYWRNQVALDLAQGGDIAQKYLFTTRWALDRSNGRVYVYGFSENDYLIHRYEADGTELAPLELEIEPVEMTEEELRLEVTFVEERLRAMENGDPNYNVQISDPWTYRQPVSDLGVDGDGILWARRGTEEDPFFDLWSPDGELVACAVLPGIGERSRSWKFVVGEQGILAWDENPELFQKIYIIGQTNPEVVPGRVL